MLGTEVPGEEPGVVVRPHSQPNHLAAWRLHGDHHKEMTLGALDPLLGCEILLLLGLCSRLDGQSLMMTPWTLGTVHHDHGTLLSLRIRSVLDLNAIHRHDSVLAADNSQFLCRAQRSARLSQF